MPNRQPRTNPARTTGHILRRCGFGQDPRTSADELDDGDPAELIELLLERQNFHVRSQADLFDGIPDGEEIGDHVFALVVDQMLDSTNPLHERMTLYWHTHFTASAESSKRSSSSTR